MNLVLTESPFGDGTLDAHLDTSSGELVVDTGHLESPDLTVTVDYETAKAILVDGDAQAAMQAFMSGTDQDRRRRVPAARDAEHAGGPRPSRARRRIREITE